MHLCRHCGIGLIKKNSYASYILKHNYICKNCSNNAVKLWRKNNPEKQKKIQSNYQKHHRKKVRKWNKNWYCRNKNRQLKQCKKYRKSKQGKISQIKHFAKRQRNLNWIPLFNNPFDESELIDWHHINNTYVVALPRDLHKLYLGECHRKNISYIVNQIYTLEKT